MAIALEKVLEMSFQKYCDENGVSKSDYDIKNLSYGLTSHFSGGDYLNIGNYKVNPKEEIANLAPEGTEVIVSFRIEHYAVKDLEAYGTALIPKKGQTEE